MLETQNGTRKLRTTLIPVGRWNPRLITQRIVPTTRAILIVLRSVVRANQRWKASVGVDHPGWALKVPTSRRPV